MDSCVITRPSPRASAALAARERGRRRIDRCQNLRSGTLPPFPQGHGLADGVFYAPQPSTRDGIADKCFLVGGQIYGHEIQRTSERMGRQGASVMDARSSAPMPSSTSGRCTKKTHRIMALALKIL